MNKGVILVAVNYRLGPLGFFSLENDLAPGNQVDAALRMQGFT
jgi:carboxylesterase type B